MIFRVIRRVQCFRSRVNVSRRDWWETHDRELMLLVVRDREIEKRFLVSARLAPSKINPFPSPGRHLIR